MSSFSAWGPTEDLRLKPEITTPGSDIYSSVPENSYRYMSGTSMAAPYYAGAAALMKQYLASSGISVGKKQVSEFVNALLMSTARQGYVFIPVAIIAPMILKEVGVASAQGIADALCLLIAVPLAIKAYRMIDKEESAIAENA